MPPSRLGVPECGVAKVPKFRTCTIIVTIRPDVSDSIAALSQYFHLVDRGLDNIQVAENGDIYAAGFPDGFTIQSYFVDPFGVVCPSSAVRISKNTDRSSFFGEKYKLEVIFQDNGTFTPPATSAVYDSRRERLFLHGILSTHLTVCEA
ncbi:hypothetical protein SISNIDRAFT_480898 [Sistotremastrum niveocremeum HHB9708]|uniref:Uncharacterized protein n=1 Tax=Sistotremastrum niveocremeum HHB9708 TaxID=1314777 RepID=A0A164ZV50_9AGAM|nr:hypothetical protein SISNIDRAFT_480898 [Sistotremastrum niveocremeum HHB9708]